MKLEVQNYEIETLADPHTGDEKFYFKIEYTMGGEEKSEISTLYHAITECIGALGLRMKALVVEHLSDLDTREWTVRTFIIGGPENTEHEINTWHIDDLGFEEALEKAEELVSSDVMNLGARWTIHQYEE